MSGMAGPRACPKGSRPWTGSATLSASRRRHKHRRTSMGATPQAEKRVQFDFEVDFSNGGGIQGQGFRLDIQGDAIGDDELADYIVRDLRLLMVGAVRILNKSIIVEQH